MKKYSCFVNETSVILSLCMLLMNKSLQLTYLNIHQFFCNQCSSDGYHRFWVVVLFCCNSLTNWTGVSHQWHIKERGPGTLLSYFSLRTQTYFRWKYVCVCRLSLFWIKKIMPPFPPPLPNFAVWICLWSSGIELWSALFSLFSFIFFMPLYIFLGFEVQLNLL